MGRGKCVASEWCASAGRLFIRRSKAGNVPLVEPNDGCVASCRRSLCTYPGGIKLIILVTTVSSWNHCSFSKSKKKSSLFVTKSLSVSSG